MPAKNEKLYGQFRSVFEKYYQPLCNYAYSFTKDKSTSEDIVQEVFLRIWEIKQDLIGSDSIRYYLFTAVRNKCLSFIEAKKKSAVLLTDDIGASLQTIAGEDQEAQPADAYSLIRKGLANLPPKCKDTFLLSRIGNLSYKEIAASMGISVKTVENQIGKAIKILRDFMKEQKVLSFLTGMLFIEAICNTRVGDFANWLFY